MCFGEQLLYAVAIDAQPLELIGSRPMLTFIIAIQILFEE
ncbi:hypothetical protein MGAST_12410 [Mycobacterium gastri 'Wayne']|nr:hypothetical protein MGAST_12410 [Mycobacterium gastri 'Wayne']